MSAALNVVDAGSAPFRHASDGSLMEPSRALRVGFLSSAPPTPCGLATFTTALGLAMQRQGFEVGIVRILDADEAPVGGELPVWAELVAQHSKTRVEAIRALNNCDVVMLQHEYGLYGGQDGSDVLRVLEGLRVPVVSILHTVLASPTRHQRDVLNEVIRRSRHVVVMSSYAEATLRSANFLGATPVSVIPHGAKYSAAAATREAHERPELLSWGLLGPGKGIEWVIDALGTMKDLRPVPRYVVAGRTHPKVLAREGDAYRHSLARRVEANGVEHMVEFDDSYRDLSSLQTLIEGADVVILPYDSMNQSTSGVLVDAVAAGRPVIATAFPHAIELLSDGAGLIVPQRDPVALSAAMRRVILDHDLAQRMAQRARDAAPNLSWDVVGEKFAALAQLYVTHVHS